jgi:hypothetical protein
MQRRSSGEQEKQVTGTDEGSSVRMFILCSTPPTFRVDVRAWQKIQAFSRDGDTADIELFKGIILRAKR